MSIWLQWSVEMVKDFRVGSNSTVSGSCRGIEARMVKEKSSEIGSKRSLPVLINSILDPFSIALDKEHPACIPDNNLGSRLRPILAASPT